VLRAVWLGVGLAVAVALLGCGGSHSGGPVSVGGERISRATIDRWGGEITRGATYRGILPQLPDERAQATALLIEYRWLAGEASDRGIAVTEGEVERALRQREEGAVGGPSGYQAMLEEAGETEGDARVALRAELAAERLGRRIIEGTAEPATSEVETYYRSHLATFKVPEERVFNLAERIDGPAEMVSAKRALTEGHRVAAHTPYEAEFNLSLPRDVVEHSVGDKEVAVRAIFSTPVGSFAGPVKFYGHRAVFKVKRIVPGYIKPLRAVRSQIVKQLRKAALAHAHAAFLDAWRAKWSAETECSAGYVVPGCKEYHGPHEEEDPFSLQ
jgi:hypothetical protein